MPQPKLLRWRVGNARITRILDVEASGLEFLLPDATPSALRRIDWLSPYLVSSGEAVAAIQSFLIELGGRRILVDTGAGEPARALIPAKLECAEPYLDDVVAAGFAFDTIDTVVHTHLHFDHVGWNLRPHQGAWLPTFPNARHLVVGKEWAHWSGGGASEDRAPVSAAIRPLLNAGRAQLVESGFEVAPGIVLEPTEGHTPGHVSVALLSEGARAVISGDVMHHPAQLAHPEWACTWDSDPSAARTTRERFLDACASAGVLVFGTHFARAPAGIVLRDGSTYRFAPVDPE